MKKTTLLLALLCSVAGLTQSISGQATYMSKTTVDMDSWGNGRMSEDMKKQIAERMKSFLEKTYILTFNESQSIYKEEEKLEAGNSSRGWGMMMNSYSAGAQYKDISKNQILEEREFFGKQFLINDTITNLEWEITKESRMIGQYLAIKAVGMKQVDPNDFSMARRRNRNNDENKEETKDSTDTASAESDPMEEIEVPKEVAVTAWFTPQIPVGTGPGEYGGLPGLIPELNVDRTTILCSKIVMNPKEADKIEPPKKGDEVSREEYNLIVKQKTDEMRENWRRGGGRRDGRRGG